MRFVTLLVILLICCEAKYVPADGIYALTEEMPQYQEGQEAFDDYVKQAAAQSENQGAGQVFVSFIVSTDGSLKEAKAVNPRSDQVGEDAVKIITGAPGSWLPGIEEGQPVDVKLVYPVRF
ncbi:MAG: energy transducer TonB [Bacteroidota bacterium]